MKFAGRQSQAGDILPFGERTIFVAEIGIGVSASANADTTRLRGH